MKPLHVICVSTYSSVAKAYKCALKGISGSQKKQTREDVCSAVVSDHYCMFNRWQPLGVFSSWRSWCLHSSSRSHCMCVCYCLCVQWCSCNYCRLFFFLKDSLQICLELAFLLQALLWERILIRLWFQFTSTHQLSPLSIIWFLPPTCCQCSLKHYTSCLYLFHFCKTCILL